MIWYFRKDKELDYECERIIEESKNLNIPIEIVSPNKIDIIVTRTDRRSIRVDGKILDLPKVVLPRTGSGTGYYALSVLRHLERLHVPVLNTPDVIETVADKFYSMEILAQHNLPVPRTMLVKHPIDAEFVDKYIGFPCVVKVLSGSYGEGVHLVSSKESLEELMEFIETLKSPLNLLIQEFIGTKSGQDVRILVVGGKPIGAMLRKSTDGSFKANITRGGIGEPFPLTDEISYLATETCKIMGLDIGGIDLLFDKSGFKICEANSAPGFQGFEKYCGINVANEIVKYCSFRMGN
jgi:gamma-F420-2:alpha-L-glutamate ligase